MPKGYRALSLKVTYFATYETMNKRSKLQKSGEKRCNKKKYLSYVVGSTISRHYQISWGQDLYPQIWLKLGAGVILQMEKSYTWRYQVMTSKGWFCHGLWGHSLISLLPDIFFLMLQCGCLAMSRFQIESLSQFWLAWYILRLKWKNPCICKWMYQMLTHFECFH